ncbi:hypothetical protein CRENBAI_009128 [Crenichthys baileyi]|uniref:Uncharacterized protein n=1 Tax=Crenichthys baileyi TaxID=28760 RepID=A0AAV9QXI8_9TELE
MALHRENAVKLELSKADERTMKAEAKLVNLKADELKKASSQRGQQTPTLQVPNLHFHSQQPQQEADSDSSHPAPTDPAEANGVREKPLQRRGLPAWKEDSRERITLLTSVVSGQAAQLQLRS